VQALKDLLRAEMAHVEQHVPVHPAALVDLDLLRAGDDVSARELHRVRRVVLEEALPFGVQEIRTLAARPLGDQDPGRRERRRVELHHLHVLERNACLQGHGHSVARARIGVRRARVEPAGSAGREDDGLRADRLQAAVQKIPGDDALAAVVVHHELPGEELLVHLEVSLHHLLVEDMDQDVAGDVGRIRCPRRSGSAEGALRDAPVLGPREDRAPVLELVHVTGRLGAEDLDRVLVTQVVGALDRVEGVLLRAVG
jgi:hypothetical protein